MKVNERYTPIVVGADSTVTINNNSVGGFLCTAAGTITLTRTNPNTVLINAMAVTEGVYYPFPVYLGKEGATFTTASSAAGLLLV